MGQDLSQLSLGPGMVVHTFNARRQNHADLWVQGQSTEQVPGQPSLGSEGVGKQKAGDDVIEQGSMYQLQQAAELAALESVVEVVAGTIDAGWLQLRN